MSHLPYRPDIDGLRAIAVMLVLIFHAFPLALPGGYIGVDIFFVISGFLISSIIFKNLNHDSFSLREFYVRRIRRILPCLILVLVTTLIAGLFLLFPDEYRQLGKYTFKSGLFILNFSFSHKGGYFDTGSQLRPLLHLWSLCIVEQYYIVWPLLVAFVWRQKRQWLLYVTLALIIVSFISNIILTSVRPMNAFYLPWPRFWELLAGSLLAYLTYHYPQVIRLPAKWHTAIAGTGLGLIALAVILLDENSLFPGWWALLPITGAVLLIHAGPDNWINRTLLSHRFMVSIGLISYPLYLWHWPILSYSRIAIGQHLPFMVAAGGLILTAILAFATYQYVEKNIRFSAKAFVTPALIGGLALICAWGLLAQNGIFKVRLSGPESLTIESALNDWDYPGESNFKKSDDFKTFKTPGNTNRNVLIIGDSHAEQYWSRLKYVLPKIRKTPTVTFATYGACAPLPGVNRTAQDFACDKFVDFTTKLAEEDRFNTIVFIAYWESYFGLSYENDIKRPIIYAVSDRSRTPLQITSMDAQKIFETFAKQVSRLRLQNKKVYIVLSNPASRNYDPRLMLSRLPLETNTKPVNRTEFVDYISPVTLILENIAAQTGAILINPVNSLCGKTECPTVTSDGKPLYRDENHMRPFHAIDKAGYIDQILK